MSVSTQTIRWCIGNDSKFVSMAFPIDEHLFAAVRLHEGKPCVELSRYREEEDTGFISLDEEVGVRLTRTGWDQLLACANNIGEVIREDAWGDPFKESKDFYIQEDAMCHATPSTDLPPDYEEWEKIVPLSRLQFAKLTSEKMLLAINKALDEIDYE